MDMHFITLFYFTTGVCPLTKAERVENMSGCHHWLDIIKQFMLFPR